MKCVIVGPDLPAGETEWTCRTHDAAAELQGSYQGGPVRRCDLRCSITKRTDPRCKEAR